MLCDKYFDLANKVGYEKDAVNSIFIFAPLFPNYPNQPNWQMELSSLSGKRFLTPPIVLYNFNYFLQSKHCIKLFLPYHVVRTYQ